MKRSTSGLKLSKALVGFLQYKAAEGLSASTLVSYEAHLQLWIEHNGDIEVDQVTAPDLRGFIAWLRTGYRPRRIAGNNDLPLSDKSIRNYWITLSSFFTWASEEFDIPSPMKAVPAPRFEKAPFKTLSKENIEAMLKACKYRRV